MDLNSYPAAVFYFAMTVGLIFVRIQRKKIGASKTEFRAWDAALAIGILSNLFQLVMPWYPPKGGIYAGDVSFWYATYAAIGIGM